MSIKVFHNEKTELRLKGYKVWRIGESSLTEERRRLGMKNETSCRKN